MSVKYNELITKAKTQGSLAFQEVLILVNFIRNESITNIAKAALDSTFVNERCTRLEQEIKSKDTDISTLNNKIIKLQNENANLSKVINSKGIVNENTFNTSP